MTQYLLSVHGSEDSPYATDEDMQRAFADVDRLNAEIQAAGAWVFAGGLLPASTASVVRVRDGALERTDGPYLESKEHIGGFWIIEARRRRGGLRLGGAGHGRLPGRGRGPAVPGHPPGVNP